jgi:hypothetical protein
MQQQTVPVHPEAAVRVGVVRGDLRAAGWDRSEIMAKTDSDSLALTAGAEGATVSCDEDLILYLPRQARLTVESVAGDATLQALGGPVTLGPVAGDLTVKDLGAVDLTTVAGDASLHGVGGLNAERVNGDLALRGCAGPCALIGVGGDASLREVKGAVTIEEIGSDLYLRDVGGAVAVKAGADAAVFLEPTPGLTYDIAAGDDLILRLPPDTHASLHLRAGSPDSVQLDFPGVELPEDCRDCELTIGSGDQPPAELLVSAGADLLITSRPDAWESAADFGIGMGEGWDWGGPDFPLPPDFSERINRRVRAALERNHSRLEAASRRAGAKIEAAMRRAEAKARAAEVRARRVHAHVNIGRWNWDLSSHAPAQAGEPVSNDERLIILKMLQEKKISLEEAEKLLAALEGK